MDSDSNFKQIVPGLNQCAGHFIGVHWRTAWSMRKTKVLTDAVVDRETLSLVWFSIMHSLSNTEIKVIR